MKTYSSAKIGRLIKEWELYGLRSACIPLCECIRDLKSCEVKPVVKKSLTTRNSIYGKPLRKDEIVHTTPLGTQYIIVAKKKAGKK